jgi:hypothetical protein
MPKDVFWDTASYIEYLKKSYQGISISAVLMMDKGHEKNFNGFYYNYSQEEIQFARDIDSSAEEYVAEYADGKTETFNITDIKSKRLNQFKGFTCGSTNSIINIDYAGNATTSICGQKSKVNIYRNNIDTLFQKHVCTKSVCENPADIRIFKILEGTPLS